MKKIFAMAFAVCTLAACGDSHTEETTMETTTDTMVTDMGTTATSTTTTTTHTTTDGDVAYNGGKVQVYRNNTWEDTKEDVTLNNGVVVRRNGVVVRDGNEYE